MNAKLRRRSFTRALCLVPALIALASPTIYAADRFLKVGDIAGESTDQQHEGWVEIVDFAFGVSVPASADTGSSAKERPIFNDLVVLKTVDKSSPLLFLKCCTGEIIPTVLIEVTRPSESGPPQVYYTLTLTDARITSVQPETGSLTATESISFSFSKLLISYTPASGPPITAGWNLDKNVPLP